MESARENKIKSCSGTQCNSIDNSENGLKLISSKIAFLVPHVPQAFPKRELPFFFLLISHDCVRKHKRRNGKKQKKSPISFLWKYKVMMVKRCIDMEFIIKFISFHLSLPLIVYALSLFTAFSINQALSLTQCN